MVLTSAGAVPVYTGRTMDPITRRDFAEITVGGAAAVSLGAQQPASTKKMFGIQVGAVSFVDEGVEPVLDNLERLGGVNTLFIATFTYGRGIAGRQIPGQPLPDHGKQEYDTGYHGGNYTRIHPQYYKDTVLKDFRAPDHGDFDVLESVIPAARKRGMRVICWYEDVFRNDIPNIEKLQERDLHGNRATTLCFNNPDYRGFLLGLSEDYVRSYDVDGVMWGSERQGALANSLSASHDGTFDPSRATCFCEFCQRRAKEHGISVDRAKQGFLELEKFVRAARGKERPVDGYYVAVWRLLLKFPELLAWENMWHDSLRDTYRAIYDRVKSAKSSAGVGWHIWHNNSINGIKRIIVPNMPADSGRRLRRLHAIVNGPIGITEAVVPHVLPSQQFRKLQQQAPHRDVIPVHRPLLAPRGANKFLQFQETLFRAIHRNAVFLRAPLAELAETSRAAGIERAVMRRAQRIRQRALAFRSPHHAVHVIRADVIFAQTEQESAIVGVVEAQRGGAIAVQVALLKFFDIRNVVAKNVLVPTDDPHASLTRRGDHAFQHIEVAVIGRAKILEHGVLVILRMNARVVSAVIAGVVFLLAVIGQRLAGNLASRDAAAIRERRDEQRVDAAESLKVVEHRLDSFVDKGNGADLNAEHLLGGSRLLCAERNRGSATDGDFCKVTTSDRVHGASSVNRNRPGGSQDHEA